MARQEFKGDSVEEVRQALERWKREHPGATITTEYPAVEFRYGGAHFLSKNEGPGVVIGAAIVIDYEEPDAGPAAPTSEPQKS